MKITERNQIITEKVNALTFIERFWREFICTIFGEYFHFDAFI